MNKDDLFFLTGWVMACIALLGLMLISLQWVSLQCAFGAYLVSCFVIAPVVPYWLQRFRNAPDKVGE